LKGGGEEEEEEEEKEKEEKTHPKSWKSTAHRN